MPSSKSPSQGSKQFSSLTYSPYSGYTSINEMKIIDSDKLSVEAKEASDYYAEPVIGEVYELIPHENYYVGAWGYGNGTMATLVGLTNEEFHFCAWNEDLKTPQNIYVKRYQHTKMKYAAIATLSKKPMTEPPPSLCNHYK